MKESTELYYAIYIYFHYYGRPTEVEGVFIGSGGT